MGKWDMEVINISESEKGREFRKRGLENLSEYQNIK